MFLTYKPFTKPYTQHMSVKALDRLDDNKLLKELRTYNTLELDEIRFIQRCTISRPKIMWELQEIVYQAANVFKPQTQRIVDRKS